MDVGQQLFEARRRRDLTLDDITRTTKIPVHILRAIERNDEARLPQQFFTRAFVRAYAREVGVNLDDLLNCEKFSETTPIASDIMRENEAVEEPASPLSVVFVALAAVCSIYYGYSLQSASPVAPQTAPAQMVLSSESVAHTGRGDITLPVESVSNDAPVATAPRIVTTVASMPVDTAQETVTAEDDAGAISVAVESPPAVSDAIVPQPDPIPATAPVEQF